MYDTLRLSVSQTITQIITAAGIAEVRSITAKSSPNCSWLHVDELHVLARRRYRGSADAVRNNLDNIREVRARTIWCCVAAAHSA